MNISKGEKNMDENLKYNTLDNGNTDVQNKENEKDESLALSENVIESDAINNESEMQIPLSLLIMHQSIRNFVNIAEMKFWMVTIIVHIVASLSMIQI